MNNDGHLLKSNHPSIIYYIIMTILMFWGDGGGGQNLSKISALVWPRL